MKSKALGMILAASVAGTLLLVGYALVEAWQTLAPPLPRLAQARIQPAPAQPNFIQFQLPIAPEVQVANEQPLPRENLPRAQNYQVSEPLVHGNLALFLIHGPDAIKEQNLLTLQEALEQNLAVVHDTRTGQLAIDNRGNQPLFIQSGDIVKGGTQDRTLPYDLIVPPLSQGVPLAAMCVEQGRSGPRGNEMTSSFQMSTEQLPGNRLKLAAYRRSQADVWNNVRLLQNNLSRNVGASVQAAQSQTSLQLTLENQPMQSALQEYLAKLAPTPAGKDDVVGFAVSVNGQIQSADVYATSGLFQKLWPKLVRASAVDALAERQQGTTFNTPTREAVAAFLSSCEQGEAFRREVSSRTVVIRQESARHLLMDTCDPMQQNVMLHRSYMTK